MPEEHTKDLYRVIDVKRIEGSGMLVYYDGALYPARGAPTDKIFEAIYFVKRTLRESLRFPLLFLYGKNKLIKSFNLLGYISIGRATHPQYLLCPAAAKIEKMVNVFLVEIGVDPHEAGKFAFYIASIFEHDNAYRYRIQDLATEASWKALMTNPGKEIDRLLNLAIEREGGNIVVAEKHRMFARLIKIALFIPKYKRAFYKAMELGPDGLKFDREDWYWVCQRGDYLYAGRTKEDRLKEFDIYPKLYTLEELKAIVQ